MKKKRSFLLPLLMATDSLRQAQGRLSSPQVVMMAMSPPPNPETTETGLDGDY